MQDPLAWLSAASPGPDSLALTCGSSTLSYGQLESAVRELAGCLDRVAPGHPVVVDSSAPMESVVAILACLRTARPFCPIDFSLPTDRVTRMLEALQPIAMAAPARSLATNPWFESTYQLGRLHLGTAVKRPDAGYALHQAAYVIFTSGSSGAPKGVLVPQDGLANYMQWATGTLPRGRDGGAGSLLHTPLSFDFSLTSALVPLARGERLDIIARPGLAALARHLRLRSDYGFLRLTPSHLVLLENMLGVTPIATGCLLIGGEVLQAGMVQPWLARSPHAQILNHYGPTETVIGRVVGALDRAAVGALAPSEILPVGRPIPHTHVEIDATKPDQPSGEIVLSGLGFAHGYLTRDGIDVAKFPALAEGPPDWRSYRTGDIGHLDSSGLLHVVGRLDRQVKLLGHRVELGEVEAIAGSVFPGRRVHAAVHERAMTKELSLLVEGDPQTYANWREDLRDASPRHMQPQHIHFLEKFPLTRNGKADAAALQRIAESRGSAGDLRRGV